MSRKIDPQLILSIGVFIISLAAVYVSMRQANIMNRQTEILLEQTKANAWPSLHLGLSRSFALNKAGEYKIDQYIIGVVNKGTGPAIIKGVRVARGEKYVKGWGELFKLFDPPDGVESTISNSGVSNQVFAAGERKVIINLSQNKPLMEWFFQHSHQLKIEICYESVYGDAFLVKQTGFQTNLETNVTQKTDGCNFKTVELFLQ
ncbi:MAG: hypothetical protein AAGJ18_25055 [Bacteroidota bacterium]